MLNNAGIFPLGAKKNAIGVDLAFATNHLGPFAFTEALVPHLADNTNVVFVASGVEDPERKPAKATGFRGGRYISAVASARGEWEPDGSRLPGADAYATSKQCTLATAFAFARETPRIRFNAIEPGFTPNTGLGRDANAFVKFIADFVLPLLAPRIKYWSTPQRAARLAVKIVTDPSTLTGIYYDDEGAPMLGSQLVRDPQFQDRVVPRRVHCYPRSLQECIVILLESLNNCCLMNSWKPCSIVATP